MGGEGRTSGMASEVCMDKGMCKSRTQLDDPDYPGKKWRLYIECTSGLGR